MKFRRAAVRINKVIASRFKRFFRIHSVGEQGCFQTRIRYDGDNTGKCLKPLCGLQILENSVTEWTEQGATNKLPAFEGK